ATVKASGNLSAGGVLQLGQVNVAGMACYPNGLISRDANGGVLSCQSGAWVSPGIGRPGYYCRRTSFDKGRSDDYVGFTPRTDDRCPVIQP
ncbi:shufflon system plasmid conjugative transfer pilus tip adhesin PilV, partial [Enterobacter hormaechei]